MKKHFNTAGVCIPSMHYMVNIEDKFKRIMEFMAYILEYSNKELYDLALRLSV